MAFSVSYLYQVLDKYSGPLKKIARVTARFKHVAGKTRVALDRMSKSMRKVGKSVKDAGETMMRRATAAIVAAGGAALFASGKIEQMAVGFEVLLGSVSKAKDMVADLVEFTARTPFQLDGVQQSARVLLGFGVVQDKIIERLRMLGDLAAGTGGRRSISDLAVVFGKMKAKGKATMEELNQVIEGGIPILEALAKTTGVAKERIIDMVSKGKIKFPVVLKAMQSLTSEGGKFAGMMDRQSKTLFGLFSTLKDGVFFLLATFGDVLVQALGLKGGMADLIVVINEFRVSVQKWVKENPVLAKWIAIIVAGVATLGPLLIAVGVAISIVAFAFKGLAVAIALIASPLVLIGALIAAGVAAIILYWDELKLAFDVLKFWINHIGDGIREFFETNVAPIFEWIGSKIDAVIEKFKQVKEFITSIPGVQGALLAGRGALDLLQKGQRGLAEMLFPGLVSGAEAADSRVQAEKSRSEAMRHQFEVGGSVELGLAPGLTGPNRLPLNTGRSMGFAGAQ